MSMSRKPGGLQTIHKVIIIAGGVLVIAFIAAVLFYNFSGDIIYKDTIEGKEVNYTENKIEPLNIVYNVMIVQDGMKTYKMYDYDYDTSIDWKNENRPSFEKDNLEKIIIIDNGEEKTYDSAEKNLQTLDGKHVQAIFESNDALYNQLRNSIRAELRENYKRDHQLE